MTPTVAKGYNRPMSRRLKVPNAVAAGLFLAVALDTLVQIAWKLAVSGIPDNAPAGVVFAGVFGSVYFYFAMLGFAAQFVNWMSVLAQADLSFAQPITALGYISVLTLSSRFLHEDISPARILGVALILTGVFFISRTPYRTTPIDKDERGRS